MDAEKKKVFYQLKSDEKLVNIYKELQIKDGNGAIVDLIQDEDNFLDSFDMTIDAFMNNYDTNPPNNVVGPYRNFLSKTLTKIIKTRVFTRPLSGKDLLLYQMYHKRVGLGRNNMLRIDDIVSFNDFVDLYNNVFHEIIYDNNNLSVMSFGANLNTLIGLIEAVFINKASEYVSKSKETGILLEDKTREGNHSFSDYYKSLIEKGVINFEDCVKEIKNFIKNIGKE